MNVENIVQNAYFQGTEIWTNLTSGCHTKCLWKIYRLKPEYASYIRLTGYKVC